MNFFQILDKIKKKHRAFILYCLLDRIPIIVFGDDQETIDDFLIELSDLVHFRKEFVFYTDFISDSEHKNLILNEEMDYNAQRFHIRCPCSVSLKAINQFNEFNSWILGIVIPKQKENCIYIKNVIRKKMDRFLTINISANLVSIELEGMDIKTIDLTLEESILQKLFQDTENSITRMKRVLTDKIKSNKINKDLLITLLDFELEKNELKKNIFNKEIQNFYSASKRAFFILSRLNLLNTLEINATIGTKTLLKTIDYNQSYTEGEIIAPIERINSFIKNEWSENFSAIIQNDKRLDVEEKIQSLWG